MKIENNSQGYGYYYCYSFKNREGKDTSLLVLTDSNKEFKKLVSKEID